MEYLGVLGFALAGLVMPWLFQLAGGERGDMPVSGLPIIAAVSAALISACFLIK